VFLAGCGMILQASTTLWTLLKMRAPGVTLVRIPVFCWSQLVTCLMVAAAFPALLLAMIMLAAARISPHPFGTSNAFNVAYENLFWFYGHPVVYVMFFPFIGCVAEVLATFSGHRFFGYKGTAISLLAFAAGSMAVWGHHLLTAVPDRAGLSGSPSTPPPRRWSS
jgi:cytochrome c oxidase subunit 1